MYQADDGFNSDHVFFFSYTQPQQKGGVLNMWSDADALAKINSWFAAVQVRGFPS